MSGKVTVVGSFNLDMVVKSPRIPKPGETILGGEFMTVNGGKGANQAVAAARMGADVTFICRLGSDGFGDNALESFKKDKIDVSFISRDPRLPTGVALIVVDEKGENSIVVASGANGALGVAEVDQARRAISASDVLLCQLETPLEGVQKAVAEAFAQRKTIVLNPAPARELPDTLLKQVTVLTPNETEAELLTGVRVTDTASAERACDILHGKGVTTVLLTMGARGVFVCNSKIREMIPAPKVTAVDTTAAGDVFSGALSTALAEGRELLDAVRFGCRAASLSVTRAGAQSSIPYRREVDA